MASRMIRWRPWVPQRSKKLEVRLVVRRIEGMPEAGTRAAAEVKWRGPRTGLRSLRRGGVKRNRTRELDVREGGVVEWNEEFLTACSLTTLKDNGAFLPWEIAFTVFAGLNEGSKKKGSVVGVGSLNLAEFSSTVEEKKMEINVSLLPVGVSAESHPTLHIALTLVELRTVQESLENLPTSIVPVASSPSSGDLSSDKDEFSAPKVGSRRISILKALRSSQKSKKAGQIDCNSEEKSSQNDDSEHEHSCKTNSLEDDNDGIEASIDDSGESKSFSYGTLASAKLLGGVFYSDMMSNKDYEVFVYYSHQKSEISYDHIEKKPSFVPAQPVIYTFKRSILPWKKKRYSYKSPKAKGEPLLKKSNGEEGGDDIDFDRRQLICFEGSSPLRDLSCHGSSLSIFGDDNFVVGSWEPKEIVNRDGHLKLRTQAFFASIDQRSEQASGESACSVLVAVIADWFQANPHILPIKSQFDNLIREGSLDWRNLCENKSYMERFPDGHFDLETVLEAKIRSLSIVPAKSFVGFFHPEETNGSGSFHFLRGAMSFDHIWDEITEAGSDLSAGIPLLYIVSWNDHFFIIMVEHDAYYIIDTLGERLREGCNQAYILKFDDTTTIHKQKNEGDSSGGNSSDSETPVQLKNRTKEEIFSGELKVESPDSEDELICQGKESCKEYIKSFLAAIPIRELQVDLEKGLKTPTLIHHRLQIEFHYTEALKEQEQSTELQPTTEPAVIKFPYSTESDSEPSSSPTESDLEPSWSRDATPDFSWPEDLSWPPEPPTTTFLLTQPVNLKVEVV